MQFAGVCQAAFAGAPLFRNAAFSMKSPAFQDSHRAVQGVR
jgi:hypothetical protein